MKKRVLVIFCILVYIVLFMTKVHAQNFTPQGTILLNTEINTQIKTTQEISDVAKTFSIYFPSQNTTPINEINTSVEYFFQKKNVYCSSKIGFGFIPTPAACYQSENEKIQFVTTTSGKNTIFILRYWF